MERIHIIKPRSRPFINVSEAFRFAAFEIHETTMGIDHQQDGKADGRCKLTGVIGDILNILLEKLQDQGFGCIASPVDSIGMRNPLTNQYTGGLGKIQRGEVDFLGMPVYFPVNESGEEFRYSAMPQADTMTILSSYSVATQIHEGDVITMFANIPTGLWIGYFMSFLLFLLVSFVGSKMLGHMVGSLWMTICAFLDQDNYPLSSSKFISFMSFVVMLGMFFMMSYAENCMSTDLVTIDKPIAITTYDQIIAGNITSLLNKLLPEWERFSSAENGTKERALFDRKEVVDLDIGATAHLLDPFSRQEVVFITRPVVALAVGLVIVACNDYPTNYPTTRMFLGPDPQAVSYMNVFVHSARLKDTPLEHYMNLIFGRMGEHGFMDFVQSRSASLIVKAALQGAVARVGSTSHEQVITSKIEEQSPDVMDIGWIHVYRVMLMIPIGSLIGFVALIGEHSLDRYLKMRLNRRITIGRQEGKDTLPNVKHLQVGSNAGPVQDQKDGERQLEKGPTECQTNIRHITI